MKIAIAEDNPAMRNTLNEFLRQLGDYEIIFESENGIDLIKKMQVSRAIPKVVIVDINMPVMDGIAVAHYLRIHQPDVKVLCISSYFSEQLVVDALDAGASGFLKKGYLYEQLKDALQEICSGGIYLDLSFPCRNVSALKSTGQPAALPYLTQQERLFLLLCATNTTYQDISSVMHVANQTIYNYQKSLKEKLNISTREGFMIFAIQNGIARIATINAKKLGFTIP